jgi:hypothetical protein
MKTELNLLEILENRNQKGENEVPVIFFLVLSVLFSELQVVLLPK